MTVTAGGQNENRAKVDSATASFPQTKDDADDIFVDLHAPEFDLNKHACYFGTLAKQLPEAYASLGVNKPTVLYFCLSALDLLGKLDLGDQSKVVEFLYSYECFGGASSSQKGRSEVDGSSEVCQPAGASTDDELFSKGGFLGYKIFCEEDKCECSAQYEFTHIANTYTGLMCLVILGDDLSRINRRAVGLQLRQWQQPDGSFTCAAAPNEKAEGNFVGERDMRFVYCAAVICALLDLWSYVDVDGMRNFLLGSRMLDYGFGMFPGTESHGGSTYCALAALALMGELHSIQRPDHMLHWLVHRMNFGFNGRVNKPADTCYTFWCGSSLGILGASSMIEPLPILSFLEQCEFPRGGFLKTPDNPYPDILHSYYSVCGLSLCGYLENKLSFPFGISERAMEGRTVHYAKAGDRAPFPFDER